MRKERPNKAGHKEKKPRKRTKRGGDSARATGSRGRKRKKARDKGAQREGGKKRKAKKRPSGGQPRPRGRRAKQKDKGATGKVEAHQNAPRRPARLTRPRKARTRTHARDPGVASSGPQGEVSASTGNSPGAADESPVERRTVWETGRVSDRVRTRKPPQRTQPETDAGWARQGQPRGGAPNGYDAERAQRSCLVGGQRQAHCAQFSAGLRVPRAAAQ